MSLQQGNQLALAVLYDRYSRLVYTIAFRVLNSNTEAEDLTQEVFLNLVQKQTYNPARSSLSRLLCTVTRNRAIDRVRARSNRRQILKGMAPHEASVEAFSLPEERASQGERSTLSEFYPSDGLKSIIPLFETIEHLLFDGSSPAIEVS